MRVLTRAIVALALVGSAGAHAQQVYLAEPAPVWGPIMRPRPWSSRRAMLRLTMPTSQRPTLALRSS